MTDPFTPKLATARIWETAPSAAKKPTSCNHCCQHNNSPVPKVYDTRGDGEKAEILMDYMPGEPLDKAWKKLTSDQQASACSQLAGYLAELRKLTGKRIEGLNGSMVRVWSYQSRWSGPFDTEQEFNVFLAKGTDKHPAANHAIHFSHGDLAPRNILADEYGNITVILDWEWVGWFLEY
ncbi:hypothetical protein ACJ73_00018 [Blastomyces percursus]|uniref:Aminoglycoside phosphotransferase domain-containing protein n=1 Tax=Blastomyces percursus TaxID=1658174 RepID=A0A1J9QJD9_9EURO|nr:hypothetical protein ACJ73_00018 [Blastomyces percursus]